MNVSSIEWAVDAPPTAGIEIRSRRGNLLSEKYLFSDKNGKEVTEKKWNKLIPSFRGPVDTVRTPGDDWSNWSRPYETPGQLFLSPVPRRYVQLETRFLSDDPFLSASLDEIALRYDNPLAAETRGEIYPPRVEPGQLGEFTYFLRTSLGTRSTGFDQIALTSTAEVWFRDLRIDGETVSVQEEVVENGVLLTLERPVRRSSLVEIDFQSTLVLNQTRFDAFLASTELGTSVRQQVDPGDASEEVDSQVNFISLPNNSHLIGDLTFSGQIFTPNGDGIGDRLRVEFDLLKVLVPRPIRLSIFDLSGRQIQVLEEVEATASRVGLEWDGRGKNGQLVAPGLYIAHIEVEGDVQTETASRSIAVVY